MLQLPSLQAALAAYEADGVAQQALAATLGAPLVQNLLAVRRCEQQHNPSTSDMLLRY